MKDITTKHKKPCPYYRVVFGSSKCCWIEPLKACPQGVSCCPGVVLDAFVKVIS